MSKQVASRDATFDNIMPKTVWVSHRSSPDGKYIVWYLDVNGVEKEMGRFYVHNYDGILVQSQNITMVIKPLNDELKRWQDLFDEEINLAEHQRYRYNTSAHDAKIILEQRRRIRSSQTTNKGTKTDGE